MINIHKIFLCRLHELFRFPSSEKAFFDININWWATQAIADVVAEAAEYFGNNDFDVHHQDPQQLASSYAAH